MDHIYVEKMKNQTYDYNKIKMPIKIKIVYN